MEALIFFATLIHESILVSMPCFFSVFSNLKYEKLLRFNVDSYDILRVIFVENIYVSVFLIPFLFLGKRLRNNTGNYRKLYNFFAIITCLGIFVYVYQIIHRPSIEEIVDSYSQSGLSSSSNKFVSLFTITFEHASIIIAAILSIKGKDESYPKIYQYLGFLMLFLVLVLVIVSGVRGRVLWVAEFVLLISIFKRRLKPLFFMLVLLIALIPLNTILVTQIRPISEEIAKEGGITNKAIVNIFTVIIKGVKEPQSDKVGIIESLVERAQGPRNSVALLKEFDSGNSPGLNIYNGAIFYFIPRSIINRPVIGSPTGNFKDAAIFKVMDLNYPENSFITMGPFLASAHAYWEGGYFGVILIALIASCLWILIIKVSYNQPLLLGVLVCLLCCCALLIDGFISVFTPLYSLISIFWKNLLPLFLFYLVYYNVKWPKFSFRF